LVATQNQTITDPHGERSSWWDIYRFVRGGAWGLLIGYSCAAFLGSFGPDIERLAGLVLWILALFFVIFVHEIGHAIGAILVGWRLIVFAAGPIGFQFHNRDFAIIRRSHRTEAEGFVLAAPRSPAVWTRIRYSIIIAAGPVANLILTAVAIVAAHRSTPWTRLGPDWPEILIGLACLSAAPALSTLTPSTRLGGRSDIQNLVQTLRTTGSVWTRERAIGWLFSMTKNKLRLRDLPSWMVEEARAESNTAGGDLQRAYESLIIGIVLDSRPVDTVETRKLLDTFRAKHGGSAWLDSCDAYFISVWEGDADRARARLWVGDAEDGMLPMRLAADAAVQARSGDEEPARMLLAKMRQAVRKQSAFHDLTFRDIEQQIVALLPA
jgi:hypothetical protein